MNVLVALGVSLYHMDDYDVERCVMSVWTVFADVGVNVLLVALLAQVCFSMPRPDPDCQRFRGMASAAHQLQQVSIKLLRAVKC